MATFKAVSTKSASSMAIPTFSIVTTNYNCAHALRHHLDSIYSQLKVEQFEYIVVDSASTDGSQEIYREYAAKQGLELEQSLAAGMEQKSLEFREAGSKIYRDV